ncbi:MAG: type I restriction endonuclease subunit R [Alteromonas sp. TMED35]|jgi:type I restriction enzyme S subunit|nr:MAG: type I restriction endonuclease subunit R [Alteromonas sp. TMED35]|tara:strand:- start:10642 stop:11862 length:1221 start_codon:yes stop_codon:yes gene_type:complete
MVPEGWLKTNFGTVTEIANGQVDPKVEPYLNMLHIGPENVVSGSGQIIDVITCKESGFISGKYEFDENAIVYSKIRPNLNKVCRPRFKGVCSADMYPIWAKSELDIDFLLHCMLGPQFYKVAVAMSMRTGMPKINRSDLNTVPLLLPPYPEQKKIAQILSTWDKAIITTEQLLANSQQQKKALMQQLLTGKKRLLDENGVRFSGEWKFQSISQISKRIQRKSDGEDHPILTISSLSGFVRQDERYSRYMAGESVKNYILLKKGEFAYNKGNSKTYEFGCIFDLDSHKSGLVPHVYVCFKLHQGLSHRYFKYLFEADYLKPQLGALVNTGVRNNGLLNIKPAEFMNTKVPVPCFDEQERIADVLHASSETISKLQLKLDALKQEKKALMQQLLTGKRRVKVDDMEVA